MAQIQRLSLPSPRTVYLRARRPLQGRQRIFFLHIPKCGGTSINRALRACYGRRAAMQLNVRAGAKAAALADMDLSDFKEKLLLYFMSSERSWYVGGHFDFSETAFEEFGDRWDFITLFRDPVKRWFSAYFFSRYKRLDHLKIYEELEEFLDSERAMRMGHSYVAMLGGAQAGHSPRSPEAMERAKATLDRFALYGRLEDLGDFLGRFEERYGVGLHVPHSNKSPAELKLRQSQVTPEIRKRVEELCQPDLEMYEHVVSRLSGGPRSLVS